MKKIYIFIAILSFFFSCSDAEKIFKGSITIVKNPKTDILLGKQLILGDLYAGYPIVFDSIISFIHEYGDYYVANFNLNNGKHLGNYMYRGQGPGEFLDFIPLHFEDNKNFWIHEYNKRQFILVDMSSGIEIKRINFLDFKKKGSFPFAHIFILNDSLLIAINQPEKKNFSNEIMVPKLTIINYLTLKEITDYHSYDESLYNKLCSFGEDQAHLLETYCIKPDKSKVVSIMTRLYQINILDLKTGKWNGYRIADTQGFNFVHTPLSITDRTYQSYYHVSVDDDFIYAMLKNIFTPDVKPVIHVFDWNGNFIRILEFDQKGTVFDIDRIQKKLYFKDQEEEENIWVYDVSYLYK